MNPDEEISYLWVSSINSDLPHGPRRHILYYRGYVVGSESRVHAITGVREKALPDGGDHLIFTCTDRMDEYIRSEPDELA